MIPKREPVSVGVIGQGVVGRAAASVFAEAGHPVVAWDRADSVSYPAEELGRCAFAVVCVETPTVDGRADLSSVRQAVERAPCRRILLKSTVPPGTTDQLAESYERDICYWPEYIGQSAYHNPFFPSRIQDVPFVVLGGPPQLRSWFVDVLLPILGPTKTYFQCSSREAELIKYVENSYFATKITFVNEMRRVAQAFGVDWHTVREGWLLDPRVERMHTAAFRDQPGFGGRCLPKDVQAIVEASGRAGWPPTLLAAVLATNELLRADDADVDPDR